jgi:hypothetical protein
MAEYTVRPYRPADEDQIATLQRHLWGTSRAANAAYLRWKYFENPYLEDPILFVATSSGRVVAMRGVFGATWEIPGRERPALAPCASDLVIDPSHRDRGLYAELNAQTFAALNDRTFPHIFNLSANPENYLALTLTQGWKPAGSLKILTRRDLAAERAAALLPRVADSKRFASLARRLLNAGRRARERSGVDPFRQLDRAGARSADSSPIVVMSTPPVDEMAALVERLGPTRRVRHVRDVPYLAWRYRNPRSTYRFVTWGSSPIQGYLVLQNVAGRRRTAIVDWEGTDTEVCRGLLDFVIRSSRLGNLRTWSATLEESKVAALRNRGFAESFTQGILRYSGRFLVKPLAAAGSAADAFATLDLADFAHWDLRMVYSDAL